MPDSTYSALHIQVASFGDFFIEQRVKAKNPTALPQVSGGPLFGTGDSIKHDASTPKKRHGAAAAADGPVEALTYRDPFGGVYKRFGAAL